MFSRLDKELLRLFFKRPGEVESSCPSSEVRSVDDDFDGIPKTATA